MIEHIAGFVGLFLAGAVAVALAARNRTIAVALLAAFIVRAAAAVFHRYVAALPDGTADARAFEKIAWIDAREGFAFVVHNFPGVDSKFYSWLLALVYTVVGRAPLLAQSFSVLAGTIAVFLTWRLASELWGERNARKAAWAAALFPTLVLYSALTMREAFVVLLLLLGLIAVVQWVREGGAAAAIASGTSFLAATFFHGGMFVALLAFGAMFAARHGRLWITSLRDARIRLFSTVLLLGVFIGAASYIVIDIAIPKIGSPGEVVDVGRYLHRFNYSDRGMASYPSWAVPSEGSEILWKTPIRIAYFLFGPFVWDLSAPRHLLGWLDSMFYVVIVFLVWRNRKAIWAIPEGRAVLLVVAALVLVFGVAVGNFGTGLRHRSKLVAAGFVLIAPRLPRLLRVRRVDGTADRVSDSA